MTFGEGLLIATITEVSEIANIEETLATRAEHEEITRQVLSMVREQASETLTLSTEACAHCEHCTWPDAPCRFPERMFPCVESHGILVTDLAEKHGIEFLAQGNVVTWFSLILYK
jgi:predicted metal-binding protein